jgi:hypothetical protein
MWTGHERYVRGEEYGLARARLPRNVAVPLDMVAKAYATPIPCFLLTIAVLASNPLWNTLAPMLCITTDSKTLLAVWNTPT